MMMPRPRRRCAAIATRSVLKMEAKNVMCFNIVHFRSEAVQENHRSSARFDKRVSVSCCLPLAAKIPCP